MSSLKCGFQPGEEGEKGFVDKTKEFVAGFDEEKEKVFGVLEHAGIINIIPTTAGLVASAGGILSKFQLDPDTMASACVVVSTASTHVVRSVSNKNKFVQKWDQ